MIPAIIPKQKIVFLGDQSVGKTSIINRFLYEKFDNAEKPTIGIDFITRPVQIQNKTIKLQLWDTAGQERFHALIPSYIRDSNIAIMVYDITQKQTFLKINKWQEEVKNIRGKDILMVLVGNKNDLEEQREVNKNVGEQKSDEIGALFFEVSAKTGNNIATMFEQIITCIPLNNTIMTTHEISSTGHFGANNNNNNSNMLLKPEDKSSISENVNTHSNRDSELNASPKKLEADRAIAVPKPPKEEERIKLTSNAQPSVTAPQDGETKKGGCCS